MLTGNPNGLTVKEAEKILRPLAENSGRPVDLRKAAEGTAELFEQHPTLLEETGKLLDEAQS